MTSARRRRGRDVVHACTALLVVIAIWWNDNGLYGGQPEGVDRGDADRHTRFDNLRATIESGASSSPSFN